MRISSLASMALFTLAWLGTEARAQTRVIRVSGQGSTFVLNFTDGFTQQRGDSLERAAQIWADTLVSNVDIQVDVAFRPLSCSPSSGVLGSAGPFPTFYRNFPGAPRQDTWYVPALANAITGSDQNGGSAELRMSFNSDLDDPAEENNCLTGLDWFYGTGAPPSGTISFFDVVLHELAHGLGFLTLANMSSGALLAGIDDAYVVNLEDHSLNRDLSQASATDQERRLAALDDGDLVWIGSEVNDLSNILTSGTKTTGEVLMYAPSSFRGGSSVSHFDVRLAPNELMEPSYNRQSDQQLTEALFQDIGWTLFSIQPQITGASALSTPEDVPLQLNLTDFTVDDPDNSFPADFSLTVQSGTNYTAQNNTVTPDPDYFGDLFVPVTVNDGRQDSPVFTATVTVDPVNDAPVVTDQAVLSTPEDTPLTLTLQDLVFEDVDNDGGFALVVSEGDDYSVTGTTLTPDPDYNGPLIVGVQVGDGTDLSPVFELAVEVTPVNDAPVITDASALETLEDTPVTLTLQDLSVEDVDNLPSELSISVDPGANFTASGPTVTPTQDFNGMIMLQVRATDGDLVSMAFSVLLSVLPVNDPPVVVGPAIVEVDEDSTLPLTVADLNVVDVDSDPSEWVLSVQPGENYAVSQTTVTPEPNFFGDLVVPVVVSDAEASSVPFGLQVVVRPVPDPPRIVGQEELQTDEDTSLTLTLDDLFVEEPDGDVLTLQIGEGENYRVEGSTLTPSLDFFGTLQVPLTVNDGSTNSEVFAAEVSVLPINDPPVIEGQGVLSTSPERPLPIRVQDLVIADPDNVYPDDFTVRLSPGENYQVIDGSIQPNPGFRGRLAVGVTASDGALDSEPFELTVWSADPTFDQPLVVQADRLVTFLADLPVPDGLGILADPVSVSQVSTQSWVQSGAYDVVWEESAGSQVAQVRQRLLVQPILSLSPDQERSEGQAGSFAIWAQGPVPESTSVVFSVAGSADAADHDLSGGAVVLAAGSRSQSVSFQTSAGDGDEGNEVVEVRLEEGPNRQPDALHRIRLVEGPVAPRLSVSVDIAGELSTWLDPEGPDAILRAQTDPGAVLTWLLPDGREENGAEISVAPELAAGLGVATVFVLAEADGQSAVRPVVLTVAPRTMSEPTDDPDQDGETNQQEGFADEDQDGLPDRDDAWPTPSVMPLGPAASSGPPLLMEASPGVKLIRGELAVESRSRGVQVDLFGPEGAPLPGVDVVAVELPRAGGAVDLVVAHPVPFGPRDDIWQPDEDSFFSREGGDRVASAPGDRGSCPPPFSPAYTPDLSEGHRCLRIRVTDGGSNDPDRSSDRSLALRFTVAENPARVRGSSGSGCRGGPLGRPLGLPTWCLLAGGLLAFRRRRTLKIP